MVQKYSWGKGNQFVRLLLSFLIMRLQFGIDKKAENYPQKLGMLQLEFILSFVNSIRTWL